MNTLVELSAVEVADLIAKRDVSSGEVTRACLERIDALGATLNCFISLDAEGALDAAAKIDARLSRGEKLGVLAGVPLAHKDMYYRAGRVSTCGSSIRRDFVAQETATVLDRLASAGALYLGGLNMSEFATGPTGHNVHFGDCANPWNVAHAPGGSSSGSGAATAARLVYAALGSDTGGSIRIPSAMCGVVGLKPTQTRVSRFGMMPLCSSFDCAGPLTRTVRDAARVLGVIAGSDPNDATASSAAVPHYEAACGREVAGMRIGVARNYYAERLQADVVHSLEASREVLTGLGCELVEVDVPSHDLINTLWDVIMQSEAATIHRPWLQARREDYAPQVRRRLEMGLFQVATRYIEASSLRPRLAAEFCDAVFAHCDVLHVPTLPASAPTLDELAVGDSDEMPGVILNLSRFTRPISFLGLPALSVPCGFASTGLPVAFQLVGRAFDEATLLGLGHAYQCATDWHRKMPRMA